MDGLPLSEITNNDLSLAHSMPPGAVHTNNSDAGGEFAGGSGCGLEHDEARDARLSNGSAGEPLRDPD
jgi:hypothetical protein